ncbi:MAG: hypothetical protein B6I17_03415 [Tenericutes bacterium 4572_104]|nr:MAG: hypothetical protein B6I17_03415 [Tenericutes bacterium 4572_104]
MNFWVYFMVGISVALALGLMFLIYKNLKEAKKILNLSVISIVFVIIGLTIGLWLNNNSLKSILIYDAALLIGYSLIMLLIYFFKKNTKKNNKLNTKMTAFLGIIVGMASVLMILGFSIIPGFIFLKVEFSALVIFVTLLWFDFKTAVIVSLLTNILHFLMPGTPPLIPLLDEMVNFLATMIFILPTAIYLNKDRKARGINHISILWLTILGVALTTVLMVLFNQYINLPIIYKIDMSFKEVLTVFGIFNFIKWSLDAFLINLTWKRFYSLKTNIF